MVLENSDEGFQQFQEQAEKAVNLVSALSAQDKLRAALLWNTLSTKLQTIIDSCSEENLSLEDAQISEFGQSQNHALVHPNSKSNEIEVAGPGPTQLELCSTSVFDAKNLEIGSLATPMDSSVLIDTTQILNELPIIDTTACLLDDDARALEKVVDEVMTLENEKERRAAAMMNDGGDVHVEVEASKDLAEIVQSQPIVDKPREEPRAAARLPFPPNLSKTTSWSCLTCSQVFEDVRDYEDHVKTAHVRPKQYRCGQCPRSFSTKGNLNVHIRNHTGEKPFCCPKCCASFTSGGNLRRHLLSHQGLKPYRCSTCDSCFTEKKSLIVHQRSHSGERPFKCSICPASFSQNCILKNHLLSVHSEEKAHGCTKCGKKFKQKSHLRIHEKRHAEIKKHTCPKCTVSFVTNGDLSRHLKSHAGIKAFNCETCGKGFMRQHTLKEHMNRHLKS